MAHNINTYIGREAAWHKLGTVTGKYMTWAEILAHGGLDFEVLKRQLEYHGKPVESWGTFRMDHLDVQAAREAHKRNDAKALDAIRDKAVFLGNCGKDYKVLNHASGFEIVDALMQTADGAHYETAGVLGKGEVVWGLADLGLRMHVGKDEHTAYLLFVTSHNGSYSYQFRGCDTRVVCNNTLDMALGEKTRASFRIRHTTNAMNKVNDAHKALSCLRSDVASMEDKLNFLAQRKMTRESMVTILDRLWPRREKEDGELVAQGRRENILSEVLALYESCDHNAFPEQRGTAYNLLNAVTEYTDHQRSSKNDNRAQSALFGSGNSLKTQALNVILEQAQTLAPVRHSGNGIQVDFADLGLSVAN